MVSSQLARPALQPAYEVRPVSGRRFVAPGTSAAENIARNVVSERIRSAKRLHRVRIQLCSRGRRPRRARPKTPPGAPQSTAKRAALGCLDAEPRWTPGQPPSILTEEKHPRR